MAFLILELLHQKVFPFSESNGFDMLASKSYIEGHNFSFFKNSGTQSQLHKVFK